MNHKKRIRILNFRTVRYYTVRYRTYLVGSGSDNYTLYRQSLSRELASLQLESPSPTRFSRRSNAAARKGECRRSSGGNSRRPILKPRRRGGRSVDGGGSSSDTENMAEEDSNSRQQLVPAYKLAEVEKKCADLTNKLRVRQFNLRTRDI